MQGLRPLFLLRLRYFFIETKCALDYQTFHAEPQSLLSRRDITCERLRPQRGLRPYEERAEGRASVGVASESAEGRASVKAASKRLAGCDKNSEVERGLWSL